MKAFRSAQGTVWLVASTSLLATGVAFPRPQPTLPQKAKAILEDNCRACHGAARMSGLDLRERETMLKGGTRPGWET